jgi:hypothetical protein
MATATRAKTPPAKPSPKPQRRQQPQALAAPPRQTLPAEADKLVGMMEQDAGMGVSMRPRDNITPSISVLQPLSPLVLEDQGKAGDFLMTNAPEPIVSGKVGFYFQPVSMTEWWFEFIPRDQGGGFVSRFAVEYDEKEHIIPPDGAEQRQEESFRYWFPETGNECVHYRFIPGIVWQDGDGLEYVIQFHGTGHTVARAWNTAWTRHRLRSGKPKPAFGTLYHLTTTQKSNKKGTWYQVVYDKGTPIEECERIVRDPMEAYRRGKGLALAFASGDRVEGVVHEEDSETSTVRRGVTDDASDQEVPF